MNAHQKDFLALGPERWPARLSVQQVAWVLGLESHHIAPLVAARLLVPLGKPAPSAPKFFATADVLLRRSDPRWLGKATDTLTQFWKVKNSRRRIQEQPPSNQD